MPFPINPAHRLLLESGNNNSTISRRTAQDAANTSTTTSVSVSYPGSTVAGNLLWATAYGNTGNALAISGWTGLTQGINSSTAMLGVFYKIADGTETSITATQTAATVMKLHIYEYTGNSNPVTFDVALVANNTTTGGTSWATSTITTTNTSDLILAAVGLNGDSTSPSWSGLNVRQTDARLIDGDLIPGIIETSFAPTASWTGTLKASAIIGAITASSSGSSYLLLEDNSSKLILDEQIALDDPLNAATVSSTTPGLTFAGEQPLSPTTNVIEIAVTGDSGAISNATDSTFATIRAANGSTAFAQASNIAGFLWASTTTNQYNNFTRSMWRFDMSVIPAGQKIVSATLSLYGRTATDNALGGGKVGITQGAAGTTLVTSDYQNTADFATRFASDIDVTAWSTSAYNNFDLNAAGLTYLTGVGNGIATLSSRTNYDIDNTTAGISWASGAAFSLRCYGPEQGAGFQPKLVIYTLPISNLTYEVEVDTVNTFDSGVPAGTASYYFNASDSGPTDAGAAWTNDANAFDGSTATFAFGQTEGGGNLIGSGTNAPTSGGTITQVRARLYAYESGDGSGTASYSNYTTLSTPTGGWTWQKVNDLEADLVHLNSIGGIAPSTSQAIIKSGVQTLGTPSRDGASTTASQSSNIARAEVEVTYSANPPLLDKTSDLNIGFVDDTTTSLGDDRLLLEDNVSYLLLEDNSSKLAINYDYPTNDFVTYTVPAATLSNSTTYYWRVRPKVQNGGSYTSWSEIRSFTVSSGTSINVSDSPTITESVTVLIPNLFVSASDTATITETVTKELNSFISVSDTATTTETQTLLGTSFISVSDSPTLTESITKLLTSFINVSDAPTITEAASVYVPFYLLSVTESTTITESILLQDQEGIAVLDTPSVTESVQLLITSSVSASDSPTITESQTLLVTSFLNKNDTATITEVPKAELNSFVSVSDTASITESVQLLTTSSINVSDSPTITEATTLLETSFVAVTDSPAITETQTLLETSFISNTDLATITETPTVTIAVATDLNISVSDTATITESTSLLETSFINTTNTVNIVETQSFLETSFISVSDSASITEVVTLLLQSFLSVSDNITVTESPAVYVPFYLISASDSLGITENQTLLETSFINVSDTATITESTTRLLQSFVSVSDTATTTESQTLLETSFVNTTDSTTITETTTRLPQSFISVSDTATITETTSLLIPTLFINASDAATISETFNVFIQVQGAVSVSDSATITEAVTLLIPTLFLSVTDSTTITETVTPDEQVTVNATDTPTITETTTRLIPELFLSVSDNTVITDTTNQFLTSFISVADNPSITEATQILTTGGTLNINVSDSVHLTESKSVFIEGTPIIRAPSIIFLTDGRLAVKLSSNMYMPL